MRQRVIDPDKIVSLVAEDCNLTQRTVRRVLAAHQKCMGRATQIVQDAGRRREFHEFEITGVVAGETDD